MGLKSFGSNKFGFLGIKTINELFKGAMKPSICKA
jgi:hypothetical protein